MKKFSKGGTNEEMAQESEQEFCDTRRMLKKVALEYIYIYNMDGWMGGRGPKSVYSWMEDGGQFCAWCERFIIFFS